MNRRKLMFISIGVLFIAIATALSILSIYEKEVMAINLLSISIPLLFTGLWNVIAGFGEKEGSDTNGDEVYESKSLTSSRITAYYNPRYAAPVVTIMFCSIALAIVTAFLSASKDTVDFSYAGLGVNFVVSLTLTIYFLRKLKINKQLSAGEAREAENETGFKIAFFFASLATLGLFAIGYYIYKKINNK